MPPPFLQQMLCVHTYSPSWYRNQCLLFTPEHLYYASNYLLYDYSLPERRVLRDLCFRKLAIGAGIDSRDIKILAIVSIGGNYLFVSTNTDLVVVVDTTFFQAASVHKVSQIKGSSVLHALAYEQIYEVVAISDANIAHKISIQPPQQIKVNYLGSIKDLSKEKCRLMKQCSNYGTIITARTEIHIFDQHFNHNYGQLSEKVLDGVVEKGQHENLLSIDLHEGEEGLEWVLLTKNKNNSLFLIYIHGNFEERLMMESKGEKKEESLVMEMKEGVQKIEQKPTADKKQLIFKQKSKFRIQLKITYPKVMLEKLKNHQKAAMTVKYISSPHKNILITGKLGEIFTVHLQKLNPELKTINFLPHSIEELPPYLSIWDDSKHYREIYSIYQHQGRLYMISTDQNLSVWNLKTKIPKHIYSIKFVTAETQSFFSSQADPGVIFFLLKDSVIRSMSPIGHGGQYLNEYWRHTKKFNKISKVVCHISEPGIVAMVNKNHQIIVYDIYEDRLMRIIEINNEDIINISFEHSSILKSLPMLSTMVSGEKMEEGKAWSWTEHQAKINKYFTKKQGEDVGLLVQQKDNLFFIYPKNQESKDYNVLKMARVSRIERIHNCKLWDGNSLLFTHSKNGIIKIRMLFGSSLVEGEGKSQVGGRFIFKLDKNILYVLEFKNKKMAIVVYQIVTEEKEDKTDYSLKQKLNKDLSSMIPIAAEQLVLDYHSCQGAFYNQKDDKIGIIDFSDLQSISIECYELTSKVESLTFYRSEYLAIGFKDQSVKVLKIKALNRPIGKPSKKLKKSPIHEQKEDHNYKKQEELKKTEQKSKKEEIRQQMAEIGCDDDWISDDEVEQCPM